MNLAQLRAALYLRAGLQSNDPTLTTAGANQVLSDAMHLIESEQDWPWLMVRTTVTLTPGSDELIPPADWLRTRSLRISGRYTLAQDQVEELEDNWSDTTRGCPSAWAPDGDRLRLRPVPDQPYLIVHRYLRGEPDLASDVQSPLMPPKFHGAIVDAAAWQALGGDREEGRAGACFQAYTNWLAKMHDDGRRSSRPGRIRVRPGGWL